MNAHNPSRGSRPKGELGDTSLPPRRENSGFVSSTKTNPPRPSLDYFKGFYGLDVRASGFYQKLSDVRERPRWIIK